MNHHFGQMKKPMQAAIFPGLIPHKLLLIAFLAFSASLNQSCRFWTSNKAHQKIIHPHGFWAGRRYIITDTSKTTLHPPKHFSTIKEKSP